MAESPQYRSSLVNQTLMPELSGKISLSMQINLTSSVQSFLRRLSPVMTS